MANSNNTTGSSAFGTDPRTGNLVGAPSTLPTTGEALARQVARESLNPTSGMSLPQKVAPKR